MYLTWSATIDATATAVSCGSRPAAAARARSTSASGMVVREVGDAYSNRRECATSSATSAQVGAAGSPLGGAVSTRLTAVIIRSACGSIRSKPVTWVPQ
jgi:hypothetical protein